MSEYELASAKVIQLVGDERLCFGHKRPSVSLHGKQTEKSDPTEELGSGLSSGQRAGWGSISNIRFVTLGHSDYRLNLPDE